MTALKRYIEDLPLVALLPGETLLRRGVGALHTGWGGDWAPLVLTDRRLLWRAKRRSVIPLSADAFDVSLREIRWVDQGNLLHFIFGGFRIRIRLKNGRIRSIWEGDGQLQQWIAAVREAAAISQNIAYLEPDPLWFTWISTSAALGVAGLGVAGMLYINGWFGVGLLGLALLAANFTSHLMDLALNPLHERRTR